MRLMALLVSVIITSSAFAEYRVFTLRITKQTPPPTDGSPPPPPESREVLSNLDPVQYRGYYPVRSDEKIEYTRTWTCPGRTSNFLPYCPDPNPPPEAPEAKPET